MTEETITAEVAPEPVAVEAESPEAESETPVARRWSETDEKEARALGWKAPEEWVGDKPAGYIEDPARFVERAERKGLKDKITQIETQSQAEIRRLTAMYEQAAAVQKQQFDAERARLLASQREAVAVGDVDAFDRVSGQLAKMQPPVQAAPAQPQVDPYVAEYAAKNEWVKDPILFGFARDAIDRAGMAGKPVHEQVAFAEKAVKDYFPHKFAAPNPPPIPPRVDGGGLGGGGRADPLAKLPASAQEQFRKFVARGFFADTPAGRAQYAKDYNDA
jgi:hypothetical protein